MEFLLKVILGAFGLLIIITRAAGVISPSIARKMVLAMKDFSDSTARLLGSFFAATGFFCIIVAALYAIGKLPALYVMALILGALMIFFGFVLVYLLVYKHIIEKYFAGDKPVINDRYMQVLCAVQLIIGVVIVWIVLISN
ncbi:DUF2065 family protein [bacterium]|jgi:uncharacterized protein YjeT (DUF2065 family)|nr:DUF2065 family protein [bacterium]